MLFSEFRFAVFLVAVFFLYWVVLKNNTSRKIMLLIASYVFYGAWDYRFLSLIAVSTLIDYFAAIKISHTEHYKKTWLYVSLIMNLGLLGFFKYCNFFIDSFIHFAHSIGFHPSQPTLDIILPVGISFYTFQTLSYTIDVYRGKLAPSKNLLDFSLFVSFFPQLVAGPIVKASDFIWQLQEKKIFRIKQFRIGINVFLLGFFKKVVISDNIAPIIDLVFSHTMDYSLFASWIGILLYALQIYFDFSGYSDMAIGTSKLFGYELIKNFDYPYFSQNITQFWRRWHISLSSWLKEYLYISLGGNKGSQWFVNRNLMLTMLLGGLWHGAGWNFVIWGGLHGFALIAHKLWMQKKFSLLPDSLHFISIIISTLFTFYFVCVCWIFFRAQDTQTAMILLQRFCLFESGGLKNISSLWLLVFIVPALEYIGFKLFSWWHTKYKKTFEDFIIPHWLYGPAVGIAIGCMLLFSPTNNTPFIYFQF